MKKIITLIVGNNVMRAIIIVSLAIAVILSACQLISEFTLLGAIKALGIAIIMFFTSFLSLSSCFIEKEEEVEVTEDTTS